MKRLLALLLSLLPALCAAGERKPDAVVATDGSGDFRSVQDAVAKADMRRANGTRRPWLILVKPGVYEERVYVQRERGNIVLHGEDPETTIIRHHMHANMPGPDGKPIGTFATATVQIDGDGMILENLTLENSAGPVGQALALRADGDRLIFSNCRFLGWQDTVLVNRGRQYFKNCRIEGHVDFIFGAATSYFDHCEIHCRKDGYITAASTPEGTEYGMVFADCEITGEPDVKTWLGRPWRDHARTVFLRTAMSGVVRPEGWHNWGRPDAEKTAFYAEFKSTGTGAAAGKRVGWSKQLDAKAAAEHTVQNVLRGDDRWDPLKALERIHR
ncbi:MAG: pectin esterase [Akkermansiaceae bacterium]|nr:pectin esterase [Akkermansiaceae bacterium]MCP5546381.1 pectin esterase [Akkermansiaceae bacterium]